MPVAPLHLLLVFLGGGLGSVLRYLTGIVAVAWLGPRFPWGTLTVNVVGSAVMGVCAAWIMARWPAGAGGDDLRLFLMTGILGGFTTFSAFSLDAFSLWERGDPGLSLVYVAGSLILSFGALAAALATTRALLAA